MGLAGWGLAGVSLASPRHAVAGARWFRQPPGLAILFLTQMWEIFSYYGMRTLLVYYMTKQLLFSQQHASLVYGAYVATFYFTPILGGVVSLISLAVLLDPEAGLRVAAILTIGSGAWLLAWALAGGIRGQRLLRAEEAEAAATATLPDLTRA